MRNGFSAALLTLWLATATAAQTAPVLQLQGKPYFGGSMTLHLSGAVGQPAVLAYGLNPLPFADPLQTGKGPWYIGSLFNLVPIGAIPTGGRTDIPFVMPPPMPALAGIEIVMQGYIPWQLSNPVTLPLDMAYFLSPSATVVTNPNPTVGANFGDRMTLGDLNADGAPDLIVGAWFEDYLGIDKSGRVYVYWGPEWAAFVTLQPQFPKVYGTFGASVTIADLDLDGIDDLVVAETPSDPPPPSEFGYLNVFLGGSAFSTLPSFRISSVGTGPVFAGFGRILAIGDLNDDLVPDIAVGLPNASVGGQSNAGRVDVYWGPNFGAPFSLPNPTPLVDDFFGTALRISDANGDGINDLVEASGRADIGATVDCGKIHVFAGPALSLFDTVNNPLMQQNGRFSEGLDVADLDADGDVELIAADVKNHFFICWGPDWGTVKVGVKPPASYQNPFGETVFGEYVQSLDANGDGCRDIVLADYFTGELQCSPAAEGALYVSLGPYYSTFHVIFEPMPACGDSFSWALITYDIDSNGRSELLAGSPTRDAAAILNAGSISIVWP